MVAGEQSVGGPAVCPGLIVGSSTILFCTDQGTDIGVDCLLLLTFVYMA